MPLTTPLRIFSVLCFVVATGYPNFYEKGSNVVPLKSIKDFKARVSNSSHLWFLQLYREGCGFCKLLESEYEKAATDLKHMVHFGAIDVEQHQQLAGAVTKKYGFQVQGVPTLRLLTPGAKLTQEYPGERTAKSLKAAATRAMPSFVKLVRDPQSLQRWLGPVPTAESERRAVLFSARPEVTTLFKAVSSAYHGRVRFAQVAVGLDSEAARSYRLTRLPTLLVFRREADAMESERWLAEKFGKEAADFAALSWADGEKPSFRQLEGWLMAYGRAPRKTTAAGGERGGTAGKHGGEL